MSKRSGREEDPVDAQQLVYEDPYEDEYEEDLYWDENGDDAADIEEDDDDDADDVPVTLDQLRVVEPPQGAKNQSNDVDVDSLPPKVFLPSRHKVEESIAMTYDASAYDMLHALRVDWPCLSVAILKDSLGQQRQRFPHTVYAAAGTQADSSDKNKLLLLKLSGLCKTKHDDDSDSESDSEEQDAVEAQITWKAIRHNGSVNRVKAMPHDNNILATWSETSNVCIWNVRKHMQSLDDASIRPSANPKPTCTLKYHQQEGFALDWSPVTAGRLISGDINGEIYFWERQGDSGVWAGDKTPFTGHSSSVEDLQWSPVEKDVFASCSADKTVKVWDARSRSQPALSINAHDDDVNVIGWNPRVTYLLASGCEDGSFRIWDLRSLDAPAAQFNWHKQPICSIEWCPDEDSVLAVTCGEQSTIWDLSLERDTDAQNAAIAEALDDVDAVIPENLNEVDEEVPPQLLFVHQGQTDTKEIHWHPQITGALLTTAEDGINVWKPSNVGQLQ